MRPCPAAIPLPATARSLPLARFDAFDPGGTRPRGASRIVRRASEWPMPVHVILLSWRCSPVQELDEGKGGREAAGQGCSGASSLSGTWQPLFAASLVILIRPLRRPCSCRAVPVPLDLVVRVGAWNAGRSFPTVPTIAPPRPTVPCAGAMFCALLAPNPQFLHRIAGSFDRLIGGVPADGHAVPCEPLRFIRGSPCGLVAEIHASPALGVLGGRWAIVQDPLFVCCFCSVSAERRCRVRS